MAISLHKGGNLSLTKSDPALKKITVGLGWDVRATSGAAFDLDASCFICGPIDRVRSDADFIFYNQLRSADGSVEHTGDNITGEGDGDDEQIHVDLTQLASDISKLAFTVTIHEADKRGQNFGQVSSAFIRIVNAETNIEIVRYDLSEDASIESAMIFGEVYRQGNEWRFRAVGQSVPGGLGSLARQFGVNI